MSTTQAMGLGHFLEQTDAVGMTLFLILLAMSVASWTVIVSKVLRARRAAQTGADFLARFQNSNSIDDLKALIADHPDARSQIAAHALSAAAYSRVAPGSGLIDSESPSELVSRALQQAIDEEAARQEYGQTLLASVASSAPFVGLFGTVWGIYHALISIGMSGQSSLDQVAGPVGEALIMTALGLAVAIPAALAYNAFQRQARLYSGQLERFSHDLFVLISTGSKPR
jgi:biopolymer transport protein ExbB